MGTRLYPCTRNESVLEVLAGVSKGTAQNLRDFEQLPDSYFLNPNTWLLLAKAMQQDDFIYPDGEPSRYCSMSIRELYEEVRSDARRDLDYLKYSVRSKLFPELDRYNGFITFGWGRVELDDFEMTALGKGNTEYSGGTDEAPDTVAFVLNRQLGYRQSFYGWDTSYEFFDGWAKQMGYRYDTKSWLGDRSNHKLVTRSGSVYLSELKGLYWC